MSGVQRPLLGTHVVEAEEEGGALDRLAGRWFASLPSPSSVRRAAKRRDLMVDGEPTSGNRRMYAGQRVDLYEPERAPPAPWPRPIDVAYADDHVAIVVKPPGVPVTGNRHQTLIAALVHHLPPPDRDDALRFARPVHRLDIRTGGLVVVARTGPALVALGQAFEERRVHKRYRALAVGRLEGEGTVEAALEGRAAVSDWRAVGHSRSLRTEWLTTVDLWPRTGRTHQLRLHLAGLGHPILGDDLYGREGAILWGKGIFLWSLEVGLDHPVSGERLLVEIPEPAKYETHRLREARRWERDQSLEALRRPQGS